MARLPTKFDLSAGPSLRSGRTIATFDTSGYGKGAQQFAAGVDNLGDSLGRVDAEEKRKTSLVQGADAEADFTTNDLALQNDFQANPDYEAAAKNAPAALDNALKNASAKFTDPEVRDRWVAMKKEDLARKKDWYVDETVKKRQSAQLVQFDDALEKNRRLYVDPNSGEGIKGKARSDIEGAIAMGEKSGLLTPELAADKRFKFLEQADYSRGLMEVERNPEAVSKPLPATVAERSSRAMEFYMGKGWTKEQAAGIVGNLLHESGGALDPNARNPGDGADGSDSIGIPQWNAERAKGLKAYAAANKTDWRDYQTQLSYVQHELETSEKAAGDKLKGAKTVQDATDAFIGFERPAGSDQGARNAHGYGSRLKYANQAAGNDVNPDWYKRISPEAREKIDSVADARQNEIRTQQVADAKVFQQQTRDDFNLQIATNAARVSQNDILQNPNLDNGDKATLINSLNSAMKENQGVNEFISAIGGGQSVQINPYDGDQKKIANKAFDQMLSAAPEESRALLASQFVSQTGLIPDKVQSEIRRNMATTDVPTMASSLQTVDALQKIAPTSMLAMDGHAEVEKNLTAYRHYAFDMGYSPDEAARKVISLNDPAMAAQREAIMKSKPIADAIKAVDANAVADIYDSAFSFQPALGDAPTQQEVSVGYNPESEAVIVADYKSMFEESVADAGGDLTLGKKMADERFQRLYGPSPLTLAGDRSVVKLPPEKAYPADVNGSHDYIRQQAMDDLKAEGINASEVYLQAYDQTERDVSSGRPANYQVFYVHDGKLNKLPNPFTADPATANKTAVQQSRVKQKDNLATAVETQTRLDAAGKRKEGSPDWIKAQEIQNEYQRIQNEKRVGKPVPAPVSPDTGEMPATDAMGNPV